MFLSFITGLFISPCVAISNRTFFTCLFLQNLYLPRASFLISSLIILQRCLKFMSAIHRRSHQRYIPHYLQASGRPRTLQLTIHPTLNPLSNRVFCLLSNRMIRQLPRKSSPVFNHRSHHLIILDQPSGQPFSFQQLQLTIHTTQNLPSSRVLFILRNQLTLRLYDQIIPVFHR